MKTRFSPAWIVVFSCAAVAVYAADPAPAAPPAYPTASFSAGLTLADGNSNTKLADAEFKLEHKWAREELLFTLGGTYGEQEGTQNINNIKGKVNYRHLFSDRVFGYGDITGLRDDIADVDYRVVLSPGIGYYFLKSETLKLSGEFGPAEILEKVGGVTDETFAFRFAERLEWAISGASKIWQSVEILPAVGDFGDYLLNAEIGAEAPLADKLSLRLTVRDAYDSTPAAGREKNDLTVIGSVVYKIM